jgi:phenylpropionate dioxygenase-like ring-hydroxylating dioxygenase large terminal subunit
MRVWWWKETVVNANWKMAQEAFHEGYHVMATHPQLAFGMGEDYPLDIEVHNAFNRAPRAVPLTFRPGPPR